MNDKERIAKQKDLVEQIGRFYDKEGLQPIAGRILGLLIVMDQEQFTFDEIVAELKISKSSASTALKNLEFLNQIEYVTLPGDRKRYFRLKRKNALNVIDDMERKMSYTKEFIEQVLDLKQDKESENVRTLKEILTLVNFLLEKIGSCKSNPNINC